MSQILISNLSFSYSSFFDPIFENVSLSLDSSWRLGLIGRNGKGKTTLLKLMTGAYEYSGQVQSNLHFSYFPYEVPHPEQQTIDVAVEIYPDLEEWALIRELNLLKVETDVLWRSFDSLSSGEQTKIMLAVLFLMPENFLLIDEPTNHLDLYGRDIVANYLQKKSGFILVSHDRHFLDQTIDHVLSINNASIRLEQGNYSSWMINKQRQDQFEQKENLKLQGQIRQLDRATKRTANWSDRIEATKTGQGHVDRGYIGAQSAKMMKRAKAIEKRMEQSKEEKSRLLHDIERTFALQLHPKQYFREELMRAEQLSFGYGDRCLVEDLSFNLETGDRLALIGPNGSGKSTLMKIIAGLLPSPDVPSFWMRGSFRRGTQIILSYMPQDSSFLEGDLARFARENAIEDSLFRAILNKLDFPPLQFDKDLTSYSAGQKKKVLLAKSLSESAHLYVWDEPLNYIDLISRMQIEDLLAAYDSTIVMVEHDRRFIDEVANKVILFSGDSSDSNQGHTAID